MSDDFVPPHIKSIDVYQPGKPIEELERELGITGAIKVASNENPLGPSPKALEAIPAALPTLNLYPDAGGFVLRRALGARYDLPIEHLTLGNGSNDLLYQLVLATCEPTDEVLSHQYSFLSYKLAAHVAGRPFVAAKTTSALACDADALIAAMTPRTKLVVIGTPNNPTGSIVTHDDMKKILAALPARALLVIDEAYAEYAAQWPEIPHVDGLAFLREDPRVVVLRTFSKIYGLAGLRIGFAAADPQVIDVVNRVCRTFAVSTLAMVGALAALDDVDHVTASAVHARAQIERMQTEIKGLGAHVYPSLANFVLIDCGRPSTTIYDQLLRRGIIVRPMAAWGLPSHIRVSVAKEHEMSRVISTLNDVLAG